MQHTFDARARADHAASSLLSRLAAPRHPDAGPEGGSQAGAEAFLATWQTHRLFGYFAFGFSGTSNVGLTLSNPACFASSSSLITFW